MRDAFEKELQDKLAGFDRSPEPSVWKRIQQRIKVDYYRFALLNDWSLAGLAASVLIFISIMIFNRTGPAPLKLNEKTTAAIDTNITRLDTIYSISADGQIDTSIMKVLLVDTSTYNKGKRLFRKQCAVCHSKDLITDATGPALAGITQLRSKQWLYAFTRNSQAMIASGDPQAVAVWNEWKPTIMNSFLSLTDNDLDAIYAYIEFNTPDNFAPEAGQ